MEEVELYDQQKWSSMGEFLNSPAEQDQHDIFRQLAWSVLIEFDNVSDYIWKAPNLIDNEHVKELQKLRDYFPLTGDPEGDELARRCRAQRWQLESHKLLTLFPNLITSGNLFLSLAMFESYCLRLVKLIEQRSSHSFIDAPGRGTSKIFSFLRNAGILVFDLANYREMQVSFRVRNCLIHAEGLLQLDRDEAFFRRIIAKGTYLSPWHQERRRKLGLPFDEIMIIASDLGDKIKLSNDYPHVVIHYGRDFLIAAAREAHRLYSAAKPVSNA
jgi:hypothetical protein